MTALSLSPESTGAPRRRWSLGSKLFVVALPFLLFGLVFIALTLWMSWQLEGGAAAINEAGRMRMQAYRLSLTLGTDAAREARADPAGRLGGGAAAGHRADRSEEATLARQAAEFERSLALLRRGDAARPLFVPWDDNVARSFTTVETDWARFRERFAHPDAPRDAGLAIETARLVTHIDALVAAIEAHLSRWTAWLHLLQTAIMGLAVLGVGVLGFAGYRYVLEPVGQLRDALRLVQRGDFGTRVQCEGSDEFVTLADGFNGMAAHVESMYRNLESQVAKKTAEIEEKRERLEALYDVTTLVARAATLEELANGFARRIGRLTRADGVALRWSGETNQRYLMLASQGLPSAMLSLEACVEAGSCHCGSASAPTPLRVIPIKSAGSPALHCAQAGFETLVSIPIVLHEHVLGEVDLFFHHQASFSASERSLLEALTAHLAGAMETLRLNALDKESAISQERSLLARELHDSIAQSLAFLKIQVQLLRGAMSHGDGVRIQAALRDIDAGVRESYADVRELLLHFRTRPNGEDMSPALQTTLRKFEHQSGLKATFAMSGQGLPLAPDVQIQALHIVQEALSNVRKHARATQVWLEVRQHPDWIFEIRDDGVGFAPASPQRPETHVGLRIMAERAERIAGRLEVVSADGAGCLVRLTVPSPSRSALTPAAPQVAEVAEVAA